MDEKKEKENKKKEEKQVDAQNLTKKLYDSL